MYKLKKLIALVLAVVLLVGMALHVSAATIEYRPEEYAAIQGKIAAAKLAVPSSYKYYVVTYLSVGVVNICFSESPVIQKGSTVMVCYINVSNPLFVVSEIYNRTEFLGSGNTTCNVYIGSYYYTFYYYLQEVSTGSFYDFDYHDARLVSFQNPVDKTALASLLTQANTKTDIGYTKSSWDRLQSSITSSQSVYNNADATQAQVDAAVSNLRQAIDSLLLLPTIPDLNSRITYAHSIEDVGYTAESWQDMYFAITSGQSMLSTREYSQTQLTSADDLLNNAINSLQLAVVTPPVVDPPDGVHRYLVDGVRIKDLMPAQTAIMENVDFAKNNGIKLFALLIAIWLIPNVLRRLFGIQAESRFIDLNEPGIGSAYERDMTTGQTRRKRDRQ